MLSQLSYFPTWTPQRGVARYVCHSSAAVKSFLCTGRPSVRREGPDIRGMQGPVSYEAGSGSRRTCLHQWPPGWEGSAMPTARASCFQSVSSLVCRQASSGFPGTPAGKQGRSESGRHSNALPVRIEGHPRAVSSGRQPSRHAGQSPWHPRVLSFRPSPEKNRPGRPCGAWLPRKKTL